MVTIGEVFEELTGELESLYEPKEAENIIRIVFQDKLKMGRADLILYKSQALTEKDRKQIFDMMAKLLDGQPIQYILGKVEFMHCELRVNRNVLIPRPETEEMVSIIIGENPREELKVLDVGTGSGCIAISLAKKLAGSNVSALDINQSALELARINAIANNAYVDFQNLDILKEENWKKLREYDLIVSNPPYVLEREKENMHINVLKYEPHQALFTPDSAPLLFYEKISDMALKKLSKEGRLYFEINEAFGNEVKTMLEAKGFKEVRLRQDMSGKDRFIRAGL